VEDRVVADEEKLSTYFELDLTADDLMITSLDFEDEDEDTVLVDFGGDKQVLQVDAEDDEEAE
jgi:hypothetical protein